LVGRTGTKKVFGMKRFIRLCIIVIALFGVMGNAIAQTAKPPIISKQPVAASTHAKSASLMLYVQALPRDEGALTYQWYGTTEPGAAVATATSISEINGGTSFTLNTTTPEEAGVYYYYCVVKNTNGTATSEVQSEITTVTIINKSLYPQLMNGGFQDFWDFNGYTVDGTSGNADQDLGLSPKRKPSTGTGFALPPVAADVDNSGASYQKGIKYWNTTHANTNDSYSAGKVTQLMAANGFGNGNNYLDTVWTAPNGNVIRHNDYYDPNNLGPNFTASGTTYKVYRDFYLVVELCADQSSSLYQEVATVPGKIYEWSICHALRSTTTGDVVSVVIGPAINSASDYHTPTDKFGNAVTSRWNVGNNTYRIRANANNQYYDFSRTCTYPYGSGNGVSYFVDVKNAARKADNTALGTTYAALNALDGQHFVSNYNNQQYYVFVSSADLTQGTAGTYNGETGAKKINWKYQSGSYSVPEGQGLTVFSFVGLVPTTGASGNVLDNIVFRTGNNPFPASSMFYSGRVSLSAKTEPNYVYGIVEVRGSSVELLTKDSVTWCSGEICTGGNQIYPYALTGTDFADASVTNWYYPDANGNITFNNLTPSKTYRIVGIPIGAVSKESALNTNVNPSKVLDDGYYTQITIPAAWTGNDNQMATATATAETCDIAHIYLTNTDQNVEYALLDPMGDSDAANDTVVAIWQPGIGVERGEAIVFEGLKTNYNYLVVARPMGYNEISYKVAATTDGLAVPIHTPSLVGCENGGTVDDIKRSEITREHDLDHPGYDKITLTGIDPDGEYGIYDPNSGEFIGGLFNGATTGETHIFTDLLANTIYHLAVREKATGSVFMVGVRVYPYAEELSINYVNEWVKQGAADGYIPETTAYRLRANDGSKTWLLGNGNDIDHETAGTWVSPDGTSQLYLGLKQGVNASILDATRILGATADTLHYRTQPVKKDGWVGPSVAPESEPLIIPRRPVAPEINACGEENKDYTIDYTELPERIKVNESKTIEYSLNNGENYTLIAANPLGEDSVHLSTLGWTVTPLTIPLRFPASQSGEYFASELSMQPLLGRGPAPTEAMAVIVGTTTEISGLISSKKYQYREAGQETWINATDGATAITGLAITANDYEIRYAPTCETPASLSQVLSVPLSIIPINFGNVSYGYALDTIQPKLITIRNVATSEVNLDFAAGDNLYLLDGALKYEILPPGSTNSTVPPMDESTNPSTMGENNDYSILPKSGLDLGLHRDTIRLDYGSGKVAIAEVLINVIESQWDNNLTAEYFDPTPHSFKVNIKPPIGENIPAGAIIEYSINPTFDRTGTVNLPITGYQFEDITAVIEVPNDLLEPAKEYTVYYRYKADDKHFASETKTLKAYTTYELDCDDPVVEIDYMNEKLQMKTGFSPSNYEVRVNGKVVSMPVYQVSAEAENDFVVSVVQIGGNIVNPNIPPSVTCSFTVIGREGIPSGIGKTETTTSGTISLGGNFQYRVAGNANIMANWQNALNVTGSLPFGAYEVRNPATTTKFASKFTTVTLLASLSAPDKKLYVDLNAIGNTSGNSWYNATPSLEHALVYARDHAGSVDSILVAIGTYKPETGTDRNKTFTLPTGVVITGGYYHEMSSNEASLIHTPNASSILSGDLGTAGNAYHVVTANGVNNVTLNGFVITGGSADGANGGAIYSINSTLKLINVAIHSNTANNGGGVYIDNGTASLTNVTISANSATNSGGGIYRNNGTVIIDNTIIYGNTAPSNPEIYAVGGTTYNYSLVGDADPLFVNPTEKDFRLKSESPALNAGNDILYQTARGASFNLDTEADAAGKKRLRGIIDIGAYEAIVITGPDEICSGETSTIESGGVAGTYSSSDPTIAFVNANDGTLSTDVNIVDGVPFTRPEGDPNIGKGGTVIVTFTALDDGNTATKKIVVKPRTKKPIDRWKYDGICPVDESQSDEDPDKIYSWKDTSNGNILTSIVANDKPNANCVPDSTDHISNYFANYMRWDYLVENGIAEDNPDFYDFLLYSTSSDPFKTGDPFKNIRWYDAETGGTDVTATVRDKFFWQSEPYASEVYWASVIISDSCESRRLRVEVNIYETPEVLSIPNLVGYVQTDPTHTIDLSDFLNLTDPSLILEWYANEDDAQDAYDAHVSIEGNTYTIPEPSLDLTQPTDIIYWIMRADIYGCRSLPTPFHVQLFPIPTISIESPDLVCPGTEVTNTVSFSGTAPYYFKIVDGNSSPIKEETVHTNPYSFITHPVNPVTYKITSFSDSVTSLITTDPSWGLFVPAEGYFDKTDIDMIVTEITAISPAFGPTAGGIYTTTPSSPVKTNGTVTISGHGFTSLGSSLVTSVLFDNVAATNVHVDDNNTITCTPPAHASGAVTVSVVACVTIQLSNGYRYEPIHITDIQPKYGPVTGGTHVTIQGVGLWAAINSPTISFAGVTANITSYSENEIQCITGPSNKSLLDNIVINNGAEEREFVDYWTYYPVVFIKDGVWSREYNWETQTDDRILPYPNAVIQIKANCLQDISVEMDSITVYPNKAYTLDNGIALAAKVFTLKDDASFLDYNEYSGNMLAEQQNVEHLLTQGRNWYISSPVQGGTIPTFVNAFGTGALGSDLTGGFGAGNWRLEYYNEASHNWVRSADDNFVTGRGYTAYSANEDIAVKFSGTYTNGNQTISGLTRTAAGETPLHRAGFNLVGNPFPSYWQWTSTAAQSANLYSTIWYRTNLKGIYEFWSYNASGNVAVAPGGWEDDTPSGSYSLAYVPPMQAFWVRMKDGQTGGTLTFSNARRAHADHNSHILRAGEDGARSVSTEETRPLLRLRVYKDGEQDGPGAQDRARPVPTDETLIYADAAALNGFDDYDSDKWFSNQGVEIFTLPTSENCALTINGLSSIADGMEIPLGFQADEGGAFSFLAKEILNLDTLDVFLRDKWMNKDFDLRSSENYAFTSGSTPNIERFSIVFLRKDSDSKPATDDRFLAYNDKTGHIIVALYDKEKKDGKEKVSVFDVAGRKLTEQTITIGGRTTLNYTFTEGVYLLRAGKWSAKVIVHL
jgi:hypothetical protein